MRRMLVLSQIQMNSLPSAGRLLELAVGSRSELPR